MTGFLFLASRSLHKQNCLTLIDTYTLNNLRSLHSEAINLIVSCFCAINYGCPPACDHYICRYQQS